MIDYLALALTHALIAIALLRILARAELDRDEPLADPPADRDKPVERETARSRRRRKGADDA